MNVFYHQGQIYYRYSAALLWSYLQVFEVKKNVFSLHLISSYGKNQILKQIYKCRKGSSLFA